MFDFIGKIKKKLKTERKLKNVIYIPGSTVVGYRWCCFIVLDSFVAALVPFLLRYCGYFSPARKAR